jgi:hypothetical protein
MLDLPNRNISQSEEQLEKRRNLSPPKSAGKPLSRWALAEPYAACPGTYETRNMLHFRAHLRGPEPTMTKAPLVDGKDCLMLCPVRR